MSKRSAVFLSLVLLAGMILRLIWVGDMEYKTDEAYMFQKLLAVGHTEPWPWLGVSSGVYIRNPGLSVWIFLWLGKLIGATSPTDLCRAVQLLNCLAVALIIPFAFWFVERSQRESWLWAAALAAVNPFAVLYHRKIWAQSVLPFFVMLFLMSWWKRSTRLGAFFWGLVGAFLGQIHMSGFFLAFGFTLWAALFDRKNVSWKTWFLGSCVGSLTLIPWIIHVFTAHTGHSAVFGLQEAVQFRYFVFWITDPLGLHLGNPLGVSNGNGVLQQLGDFLRYPLLGGHATWLVAGAHIGILVSALWLLVSAKLKEVLFGKGETAFAQNAALWGYGLVITFATIHIYRFYLLVTFPLEFLWLSRLGLSDQRRGRLVLGCMVGFQLVISAMFIYYIHVNGGAVHGDYGRSYRLDH